MDSHDHGNLFIHWIADSWQFLTMLGTAIVGAAFWYLHQVFTTRKATEKCKSDLIDSLERHEVREEKRLDEMMQSNDQSHAEIRQDVRWIKNHLISRNGDE
jgi:uncharacterized protein HemX